MDIIVAVTKNWGIGKDNGLIFSIPEDMKYFREKTKDAVLIMGRKTLESFPGKRPLKGRINIVMSTERGYDVEGAVVVHDMESAVREAENYPGRNVFVIGGESIYRLMLGYCQGAYITKMDIEAEADTFFPNLDEAADWEIENRGELLHHEGIKYRFMKYRNKNVKRVV